ncbi:uncharacterized protein LOC127130099 [Lathyrus oleraceus]|uniref:uncharacterized protein LOC127130099 n=1 Tax=Pisum sativum TaxID=3888 RepID=UPI0021D36B05|nr:uncharacterized protein LOC127130099 [Pisum sativum]
MVYFLRMKIMYSKKGIILHHLKYELELLKIFELINYKIAITPAETNHKLDFDVEGEDVDSITFKQLVGSLRSLCNTRPNICYAVGMILIGVETELTEEVLMDIFSSALSARQSIWLMNLWQDLKIIVSKPVKLTIDNKSAISLAKNLVLHGRSKHIDTKFHFLRNHVQNGVLEVVHCSTLK